MHHNLSRQRRSAAQKDVVPGCRDAASDCEERRERSPNLGNISNSYAHSIGVGQLLGTLPSIGGKELIPSIGGGRPQLEACFVQQQARRDDWSLSCAVVAGLDDQQLDSPRVKSNLMRDSNMPNFGMSNSLGFR